MHHYLCNGDGSTITQYQNNEGGGIEEKSMNRPVLSASREISREKLTVGNDFFLASILLSLSPLWPCGGASGDRIYYFLIAEQYFRGGYFKVIVFVF